MRQGLIAPVDDGSARRRSGGLRGGAGDEDLVAVAGGGCCVFTFFIWFFFVSALAPNEYGLLRNYLTGTISFEAYRGGLHLTGPLKGFMKFPATQVSLEFSSGAHPAIEARTGANSDDAESGGQPITITCAVQYQYRQADLSKVYLSFGSAEAATERFYQLSKMAISSTAQRYTPQDFWEKRSIIAGEMLVKINDTLVHDGHVEAVRFQILKVGFQPEYEASITAIQVAEQQKVVNQNDQAVQRVEQSIAVMEAVNQANIANISAGAAADAKYQVAEAKKNAFTMTQEAKADNYQHLKDTLALNEVQVREYFKIKAVQAKGKAGSKVVVGMANPGFSGATAGMEL